MQFFVLALNYSKFLINHHQGLIQNSYSLFFEMLIFHALFECANLKKSPKLQKKGHFLRLRPLKLAKKSFFEISMNKVCVGPHKDALYKNLGKFGQN